MNSDVSYRRRWGDNDRNLGPFTYARDPHGWPTLAVSLKSGDEECPGGSFRVSVFGHSFLVMLPAWLLRPYRYKVPANWDEATIKRLGRDWYWMIYPREFGFSVDGGAVHLHYGRQTHDSTTDKSRCWFIPWYGWRHVRRSFYGVEGEHVATLPSAGGSLIGAGRYKREKAIEELTPHVSFTFADYDGEQIVATTRIEESEWRAGEGWFKWLSAFRRPRIVRSLNIRFSAEVGREKGSWKGGTIGHAIQMRPGELHEAAFRRYCAEHELTMAE